MSEVGSVVKLSVAAWVAQGFRVHGHILELFGRCARRKRSAGGAP